MDGTTDAVFVKDLDGRYLTINRAGAEALGKSRVEEVIGKADDELFLPKDGREIMRLDREIVASGETRTVEETKTSVDGVTRTYLATKGPYRDARGVVAGVFGVSRDITGRKGAEERLRKSEERFRAMAQNASDVVAVVRTDGSVAYVSPSIGRVLGHEPEGRVGKGAFELVHPDDVDRVRGVFADLARSGPGATATDEFRMLHADGSARHVEAVGTNLIDDPAVGGVVINYRDVTGRKQAEEALRASEERFKALVQNSSDVVTVLGADGAILYESPSVERVVGYRPEELVGTDAFGHVHPGDRERILKAFADALGDAAGGAAPTRVELRFWHKDGSYRYLEVVGTNLLGEPAVGGIVLNSRDVTERKRLEENLRHRALHDPLTGLPNRALFADRLGHALARAGRRGEPVAVLFMDLDNFKVVNDSLGHETGDELLVAAAGRLAGCVRPGDTLARLGGDESVVLLEDVADGVGGATKVAERLLEALKEPFAVGGHEVFVTASVGISLSAPGVGISLSAPGVGISLSAPGVGGEARTKGDLLRDADAAMYRVKGLGKAGYEVFDPGMYEEALERLRLEGDLRRAIERGELAVHYQPLVRLETGRVVSVEALLRWEHPERGPVPPSRFVALAEETGLIVPLGRWVLEEACRRARRWNDERPDDAPIGVGVNLSPRQFLDPGLVGDVARILVETGLEPSVLVLEVTESVLMGNAPGSLAVLEGLKALGVKLAVDDFGAGYSSLSRLKAFPVDYSKIDRGIVEDLERDPKDRAIASAAIGLAHALGARVVAEGVETEGQLERLRGLGCDLGQGFLFREPRPGDGAMAPLPEHPRHSGPPPQPGAG